MPTIAIIGSGPTAIYTLQHLIVSQRPLAITIFEAQSEAGTGSPYRPALNDKAMLSNIASLEIPPIIETLVDWLLGQTDFELARLEIARSQINERAFFPRLVLGEYFRAQFVGLLEEAKRRGHTIAVHTNSRVVDILLQNDDIRLEVSVAAGQLDHHAFDYVLMATGHRWPNETQPKPGYFTSPWPASSLHEIGSVSVGIRGTSLSAIDALVAVASVHGTFLRDPAGALRYHPREDSSNFRVTLMSRKGLLPEADFYHPVPYLPLTFCTPEAAKQLVDVNSHGLLDAMFELFQQELQAADLQYAERIKLSALTVETFGNAYFAERDGKDPFIWAAQNLAEAAANQSTETTVPWRYAILRMHEVFGLIVPYFDAGDLDRFHKHFKQVFADDYATVPHTSIERILAMRQAGKLEILKLGDDYVVEKDGSEPGVLLKFDDRQIAFPAFIEAIGQDTLSAPDLPFPSLLKAGQVEVATAPAEAGPTPEGVEPKEVETKGLRLDAKFRPIMTAPICHNLFCLSLPYLLHQFPFVQGIASSSDLAEIVADEICREVGAPGIIAKGDNLKSGSPKPLVLA